MSNIQGLEVKTCRRNVIHKISEIIQYDKDFIKNKIKIGSRDRKWYYISFRKDKR